MLLLSIYQRCLLSPALFGSFSLSIYNIIQYLRSEYYWQPFDSWRRFCSNLLVIFIPVMLEVDCFFLMQALWIPPSNPMMKWRLAILFSCAMPAFAEIYE